MCGGKGACEGLEYLDKFQMIRLAKFTKPFIATADSK